MGERGRVRFVGERPPHLGHVFVRDQCLTGEGEIDEWLCLNCRIFLPPGSPPPFAVAVSEDIPSSAQTGTTEDSSEERTIPRSWWGQPSIPISVLST